MARIVKVSSNINQTRLRLITKGYLNQNDLQTFVPCGKRKARQLYEECINDIKSNGKKVSIFGIDCKTVLEHLCLSEQKIRSYAQDEQSGIFSNNQKKA